MAVLTSLLETLMGKVSAEKEEAEICKSLVEEISMEYSLSPRAKVANSEDKTSARGLTYIIAGGSHAARLAGCLRKNKLEVRDLTQSGWRMDDDSIRNLADHINTAIASTDEKKAVLVLQMFDNEIYHGATSEEDFARGSHKGPDGRYHIVGALAISTEEMLKDTFIGAMPIFRAGKNLPTVLIGQIPRYVLARCCDNPEHLTNYYTDFFPSSVAKGIKRGWKAAQKTYL